MTRTLFGLATVVFYSFACSTPTSPRMVTTAPDFTATVSQVTFEAGESPAGHIEQFDLWVATTPSVVANAGVVVAKSTPVFLQSARNQIVAATPRAIRAGDLLKIWHTISVSYGAAQAPPGAPA